jgi:hypothetical protein
MSGQKSVKSDTCTEHDDVDPTRISVKEGAQYPGRSDGVPLCYRHRKVSGGTVQKSAEGVVGGDAEGPNM